MADFLRLLDVNAGGLRLKRTSDEHLSVSWALLRSDCVRVRFRVRFQAVKVPIFGGFPVENPTKKANRLKALLREISLSEYGSWRFLGRLRRLSEYGSVGYLVERPAQETQAEQYSDTIRCVASKQRSGCDFAIWASKFGRVLRESEVAVGAYDPEVGFALGIYGPITQISQDDLAAAVLFDLDFRKHRESQLHWHWDFTPARKDYMHEHLFWEVISRKMTLQLHKIIYLAIIS